jgi:hypothetical protein
VPRTLLAQWWTPNAIGRSASTGGRRPVEFEPAAGGIARVLVLECMIHVINHAHFHRGQLVSQYRALGVAPPSRHLIGAFFGEF